MNSSKKAGLTRKEFLIGTGVAGAMVATGAVSAEAMAHDLTSTAAAATETFSADTEPKPKTFFTNVNVFDGQHKQLTTGTNVLVEGNKIAGIGKFVQPAGAMVIDGGGRTLMPGLIDAHVHLYWNVPVSQMFTAPQDYLYALTLQEGQATLMRGYTTVRDISGSVFGVKRAFDEGLYPGPRIYASGPGMSMTAGHADFRTNTTPPRALGGPPWTDVEYSGMAVLADGVTEVLAAARLSMRKGAHFLKMYTSGAVSGLYDPLDISEYSFDEIKAAADEAKRWNTYLAVHTYNDAATQRSLEAGATSIEHATIITEPTMKMLVEKGAFLSTQTGVYLQEPPADWNEAQKARQRQAQEGIDNLMKLAKKYNAKIAAGTDLIGTRSEKAKQAYELTNRLKWFSPAEILTQATANNAELMSWSGPRNPYHDGHLGVIQEGAYADILLVNGNPLQKLELFNSPEENLALIMKDGKIYKNTL